MIGVKTTDYGLVWRGWLWYRRCIDNIYIDIFISITIISWEFRRRDNEWFKAEDEYDTALEK